MPRTSRPRGVAFMLSQLGSLATTRFAERLEALDLTPPEAGVLRLLSADGGISQRALAGRLGTAPSRVVVLVDDLERKGLVERRRSTTDRRHHELHLTEGGSTALQRLRPVAAAHEDDLLTGLSAAQRDQLAALLGQLVQAQGLDAAVHPGYRKGPAH